MEQPVGQNAGGEPKEGPCEDPASEEPNKTPTGDQAESDVVPALFP